MRVLLVVLLLSMVVSFATAGEPTRTEFDAVVTERCLQCHTRDRIDAAMAKGENWQEIQQKMIRFGAVLDPRDTEVMGVFWNKPLEAETR